MQFKSILTTFIIGSLIIVSCGQKKHREQQQEENVAEKKKNVYKEVSNLTKPVQNSKYTIGDKVEVAFSYPDSLICDSAKIYMNNHLNMQTEKDEKQAELTTDSLKVGNNQFRITLYLNNGHEETHYRTLKFKSDIKPSTYKARIVKTDRKSVV